MFRQQLRAIFRASAFGKVKVLVPMVSHLSEAVQTMEDMTQPTAQQVGEHRKAPCAIQYSVFGPLLVPGLR
jgi:phosphotransferase system enzyme I (PtsI)